MTITEADWNRIEQHQEELEQRLGNLAADLVEERAQRRELAEALVRVTEERDKALTTAGSVTLSLKRAIAERDEALAELKSWRLAFGYQLADEGFRARVREYIDRMSRLLS